ncbi:hypothetical protein [Mesobacillus subterraneus]|uniref:Uncharacterized protein n=1 Tax=Mesobacillus subterraneus TaxID=285983 RepID=A0A427TE64_9BACI|nr:hypothetical protein [Mesobacillus subterraneus]RSD21093.1 hypothetical protein EJA10_22610 [Mesobacillus subterraneus]
MDLYHGDIVAKPFPHVLILSDQRYAIDGDYPFKMFQTQSFSGFVNSLIGAEEKLKFGNGVKIKIG